MTSCIDITALSVTGAACAIVLGFGLILHSRLCQRNWWTIDASGNAAFFAMTMMIVELVTAFASLGILTNGAV